MASNPREQEQIHLGTVLMNTKDGEPYGSVCLYLNQRVHQELGATAEYLPEIATRRVRVFMQLPADHDDLQFVEWVMRGILSDCQHVHSKYVTAWTFSDEWRDLSTTLKERQ